jgi:hypothetical protein
MSDGIREIEPSGRPEAIDERSLEADGTPRLVLPAAADLGPNGHDVRDILERAAHLTAAEAKALEREADWRWWSITPAVGTTLPAARARAIVVGRNAGRRDALAALDAGVHRAMAYRTPGRKEPGHLAACVAAAGLATLVRDLVDTETFERLIGPWRAVMHR